MLYKTFNSCITATLPKQNEVSGVDVALAKKWETLIVTMTGKSLPLTVMILLYYNAIKFFQNFAYFLVAVDLL